MRSSVSLSSRFFSWHFRRRRYSPVPEDQYIQGNLNRGWVAVKPGRWKSHGVFGRYRIIFAPTLRGPGSGRSVGFDLVLGGDAQDYLRRGDLSPLIGYSLGQEQKHSAYQADNALVRNAVCNQLQIEPPLGRE
jgi:hypothetical protein